MGLGLFFASAAYADNGVLLEVLIDNCGKFTLTDPKGNTLTESASTIPNSKTFKEGRAPMLLLKIDPVQNFGTYDFVPGKGAAKCSVMFGTMKTEKHCRFAATKKSCKFTVKEKHSK